MIGGAASGGTHLPATSSSPAAPPAAFSGSPSGSAGRNKEFLTKEDISVRLAFVVDRLTAWLKCGPRKESATLVQLCYILARGIDFSVTAGEVYARARDLPPLIKQVYKFRNEASLQPAMMLLLLSVKNACKRGWFSDDEEKELIAMANEMSSNFCHGSLSVDESKALSVISKIMPRFYPLLKFDKLIASFEAKAGYQILVFDFVIPLNAIPHACAGLLVARTDENMETSSCLISPPHVNFLVNGKPVERRTSGLSDIGPQFPTDITKLLKYGTNLIQAIGSFGGEYIIAVVSMSALPFSGVSSLQDYVSSDFDADPLDDDVIEGASKVPLNCPISFKRIKTPVKGHLCKHRQCFDFENYVAINAKRPSWRCPHCNQCVSFVDLRIDRQMCKILAETGEDATHVTLGSDGLWTVVHTSEELDNGMGSDQPLDTAAACEPNGSLNGPPSVVDLTVEEAEDCGRSGKPTSEAFQASQTQPRNDPRCRIPIDPVITDAVSPALVRECADMDNFQFSQNQSQTGTQTQALLRTINGVVPFDFQPQDFPPANSQTGRQTLSRVQVQPTMAAQSYDPQQQWNLINSRPPLLGQQIMNNSLQIYYNDILLPQNNMQQTVNHQPVGQSSGNNSQHPSYYINPCPWPLQATNQGPTRTRPGPIPPHQQAGVFAWPGLNHIMARPNNP